MRRLLAVLVGAAAMLMLTTAATAKSTAWTWSWSLGLHASSTDVQPGDQVTFSGVLKDDFGRVQGGKKVYFYVSNSDECSYKGFSAGSATTDNYGFDKGTYSWKHTFTEAGTYSVGASYKYDSHPDRYVRECVTVTVTAPEEPPVVPPAPVKPVVEGGIFLCYSKWQEVPGVWPYGVAKNLVENEGYWLPYAVPGNVPFGTNIGGFHLACNVATTQSVSDSRLGAGGETYAPGVHQNNLKNVFGAFYPVAGK
jgi:hypothetical protein